MKALVGAFNQEKALVGAFSVIVQLHRLIDLRHYLGQLLALVVRQQRAQVGEARVDALHAAPLVAVGDLAADSLLLLHRFWFVGQARV